MFTNLLKNEAEQWAGQLRSKISILLSHIVVLIGFMIVHMI